MDNLHNRIMDCINDLINKSQFTNRESSLKNTVKGLNFLYMKYGFDTNYKSNVSQFVKYVSDFKPIASKCDSFYKLKLHISLMNNLPRTFPLGSYVKHTRIGFQSNSTSISPDNIFYEYGIIDDYDYSVNQYQIKTDCGKTVGWIPENRLSVC
jgi:hypothetical protein